MRIAVIGTGHIGGTLGSKWRAAGHDVTYGARSPGEEGPGGAPTAAIADAVQDAEVVVFAVPGGAVAGVAAANGPALDGKVVIDATNNMGQAEVNSHGPIVAAAPGVRYARAFNTLGWENFADPLPGTSLFFAADAGAREVTEDLIKDAGLDPAYVGDAGAIKMVDGVAALWFALVQQSGGKRKVALRVLR